MANLSGSFPPLTGGVTQQHPAAALPNQVLLQENMVSDVVTGPRRRPGIQMGPIVTSSGTRMVSEYCTLGTSKVHLLIDPVSSVVRVHNKVGDFLIQLSSSYLTGATAADIKLAFLHGDVYILNKRRKPSLTSYPGTPALTTAGQAGFLFIKAGQFNKTYTLELQTGGVSYTYSYKTPTGSNTGDADQSTSGYIAQQLAGQVNSQIGTHGCTAYQFQGCVFIERTSGSALELNVFSSAGTAFVSFSGTGQVPAVSDLPPRPASEADGYRVAVGTAADALQYYYWNNTAGAWAECGSTGSYTGFGNMPVRLYWTGASPAIEEAVWPARFAGDSETNPYPAFTDAVGITGISSFQGRLVLLSGSYACLSDSTRPTLFMRSTVSTLLDSDAIEVASGSLGNASFEYAIPYNRDLLLIADGQVAVLPGSSVLTPKTAQIVPSNSTGVLTSAAPVQAGNMVLFAVPSSDSAGEFTGFDALLPSQYTTSQYSLEAMTDHLPRYLPARPVCTAGGGNSGFVAVLYEDEPTAVYLFQYLWKQQELLLAAWHKWVLPFNVISAHVAEDRLYLVVHSGNNSAALCSVTPGQSAGSDMAGDVPFLDMYFAGDVDANSTVLHYHPAAPNSAVILDGALAGSDVGVITSVHPDTSYESKGTVVLDSTAAGRKVWLGYKYTSSIGLPKPSLRDQSGKAYLTSGTYLQGLKLSCSNTGEFTATVEYDGEVQSTEKYTPLSWGSYSLAPGKPQFVAQGFVDLYPQGETHLLSTTLSTDGSYDMCVTGVEYTIKTERQYRRV